MKLIAKTLGWIAGTIAALWTIFTVLADKTQ